MFNANGKDLKFDIDGCRNKSLCPFPIARKYLQKISYNQEGFTEKIKKLCDQPFKPPEGVKMISKHDKKHKKNKVLEESISKSKTSKSHSEKNADKKVKTEPLLKDDHSEHSQKKTFSTEPKSSKKTQDK